MISLQKPVKIQSAATVTRTRRKAGPVVAKRHKKSRTGCKNCKLRSVKCDEFHPQCRRCVGYGVLCNYEDEYDELQVLVKGVENTIMTVPNPALGFSLWSNKYDKLLQKFRTRTAMTVSTGRRLLLFQGEVVRLTTDNSFLKHAVCALTLMHDRHLEDGHNTSLTKSEAYHWYLATAIFNQELSSAAAVQVNIEKQVSLWCTASLLGQLTFCHVEAQHCEEAWPLVDNPGTDLNWLKMSNGKLEVMKLAEGIFYHSRYKDLYHIPVADFDPQQAGILPIHVDALDQFEGTEYTTKADDLRNVLGLTCFISIVLAFWNSVHNTTPTFARRLEQKAPQALALLLLWFAKLHQLPIWWLKRRTLLEGQALCVYLERFHGDNREIQALLLWPREVLFCGIAP